MRRALIGLCLAVLGVAGCQGTKKPETAGAPFKGVYGQYFYVSVSQTQGGTVDSSDGRVHCVSGVFCEPVRYDWNATVTLSVTPDAGFLFQGWAGDCEGAEGCVLSTARRNVADYTVVAVFNPPDQLGHPNYTSPARHGPAFFKYLARAAGSSDCTRCHGPTLQGLGVIPGCTGCHQAAGWASWQDNCTFCHGTRSPGLAGASATLALASPPDDVAGRLGGAPGPAVGAHQIHLAGSSLAGPIACTECHRDHTPPPVMPGTVVADVIRTAAHVDGSVVVAFGPLASRGTATAWSPSDLSCATYCHGATLAGGGVKTPAWGQLDGSATACNACHGAPPPSPHPQGRSCGGCHPGYGASSVNAATHVDGKVDVAGQTCGTCHAMPPALTGVLVARPDHTTPAHPANPDCGACHPGYTLTSVVDATHVDGRVEFFPTAASCNVCHGAPPAYPHPLDSTCTKCHPGYSVDPVTFAAPAATHLNGVVDVVAMTCTTCHGAGDPTVLADAAPPLGVHGETLRTQLAVGAHRAHLTGVTSGGVALSGPVACAACHPVPADFTTRPAAVVDLSHLDGIAAVLASASYDRATHGCSTACHGASLSGGVDKSPAWTGALVGGACDACHAAPPATRGHAGVANDLTTCATCHRDTVNPDGSIKLAADGTSRHVDGVVDENVSTGHNACATCHPTLVGDATSYHHVMGPLADGWTVYPSNPAPTSASDKSCVQCHLDHDRFSVSRGANLRGSIADLTPAASDAVLCVSCHVQGQAKDRSGQRDDQTLATAPIDPLAFLAGGHGYAVPGSITGPDYDFDVACTKCHSSNDPTRYQDGTARFGLHTSADRRLRAPLGRTTIADDVAEDFCYRCHSNAGDPVGGVQKGTDFADWYGAATMPPGSTGVFAQMTGAAAAPTTSTDTLYFKPATQETPAGGPGAASAEFDASLPTSVLYLTSAAAPGPAGYLDQAAGLTWDSSVLRQDAMSIAGGAGAATTVTVTAVAGSGARYDRVAQFLSPPVARPFTWSSGASLAISLGRVEASNTNNCQLRYAVYRWTPGTATAVALMTATNNGTEFPTTAATSSTSMSISGSQPFAAGDQLLVEVAVYKNAPTGQDGSCSVTFGNQVADQSRLTLPATSDGTFPEFQASAAAVVAGAWSARAMSPFAASGAPETLTGTGTAAAFQTQLWRRASFTSPPVVGATTLPAAAWTLNVVDGRGSAGSSTTFLRYRIFRWNAGGTQGPDIVPWRTTSTTMGSSSALQSVTVPAAAVTATPLAAGDRIVVEVEAATMNLTAAVTANSTISFGSGAASSVVLPAKVVFAYASPALPATAGHLGNLYSKTHRPNPAEETLAYLAGAKHAECSDCHDPHQARRGNQADGGAVTSATPSTVTDTNQSWLANAWVGFSLDVPSVSGTTRAQVQSNTATTLTLATPLGAAPATGAAYRLSMRANAGAVTAATSSTLTDGGTLGGGAKAWAANAFTGWWVRIVSGTGMSQAARQVASNTGNTLTLAASWDVTPDTSSRYVLDRLPGVLTGAGGVSVTAWGAGTPTAWGEARTLSPAPGSATPIPDATTQWQVCFKCHSSANAGLTTWKAGWTDLASEFNPRNQSYHPIVAPAGAVSGTTGYGNTQLSAAQLTNGWKPGDMMYCSDCHGSSDPGYGASQGPHASAVKFVLRGPNTQWPTQADGTTHWVIGGGSSSQANYTQNQGTAAGLFCMNCHALNGDPHTNSHHNGFACTACHLLIPHGGKLKRLMATIPQAGTPAVTYTNRGAWTASTAYAVSDYVTNGGNFYVCSRAGTSAASGGPTGTGTGNITDGTARWTYSATQPVNVAAGPPFAGTPAAYLEPGVAVIMKAYAGGSSESTSCSSTCSEHNAAALNSANAW